MSAPREYTLLVDAPGARNEGVEIKPGPVPGTLAVTATVHQPRDVEGQWLRTERTASLRGPTQLSRVVPVGWDAEVEKASVRVEDGVIVVSVPRRPTDERPQA